VQSRIDLLGERLSARVLRRGSERRDRSGSDEPDLGPVEPGHQEELEGQMDLLRVAVELEGAADLGGTGPHAEEQRVSFLAHFGELEEELEQWNACVERVRAAPGALWTWLALAARKRGIEEPPFAVGALIDRLAIVTAERSRHDQLATPYALRLQRFTDRLSAGERLSLHAEGQNVVAIPGDQRAAAERSIAEAEHTIQELFDDAQESKPATDIGEARDAMLDLKQPLLESLARAAAQDPVTVSERCPICRHAIAVASAASGDETTQPDDV